MSNPGRGFTDERVIPAPAAPPRRKGKRPLPTEFWHQGFMVGYRGEGPARVAVIPFLRRETAERVAAEATANTGIPMIVQSTTDHSWYTPAIPPQGGETDGNEPGDGPSADD